MTFEIAAVLVLLALALAAFVLELFPLEVTALALLAIFLVTGLVSPEDAISGFSNRAVVAIGALFVLSHALTKTGVIEAAADHLARWGRKRRWLGAGALLGLVGLLSGFLNNTAMVAIFIPLVLDLCRRLELSPSKLLLPLSYASIFGGTLTLIGTSTNLLVSAITQEAGQPPFGIFEFTPLGLVFLALGLSYVLLFAPRTLPERVHPGDLTSRYRLSDYLTEVRVDPDSALVGRSCKEAGLGERHGIDVLAILRDDVRHTESVGTLPLAVGDLLIVQGDVEKLMRLRRELGLALLPDIKFSERELAAGGQVTAEVLVPRRSDLVGKTLAEVDFRRRFGGFVMAIGHHGSTLREKLARRRLRAWDSLLVLVPEDRLEELRRREEVILLAEQPVSFRRTRFWWLVLAVLPGAVLLSALGILEITVSALLGAVLLLACGAIRPRESYEAIDWSVIFLIAAFVPVGHAVISTGTADLVASGLMGIARLVPLAAPWVVLSLLYLLTSLLTQMVSNAAAAIILAPIALSLAAGLGVDPRPFLMAVCFAASAEFMTPMGYQTNMMVYSPGGYRFLDYVRFGAPLNVLFWIVASVLIPVFWPF